MRKIVLRPFTDSDSTAWPSCDLDLDPHIADCMVGEVSASLIVYDCQIHVIFEDKVPCTKDYCVELPSMPMALIVAKDLPFHIVEEDLIVLGFDDLCQTCLPCKKGGA